MTEAVYRNEPHQSFDRHFVISDAKQHSASNEPETTIAASTLQHKCNNSAKVVRQGHHHLTTSSYDKHDTKCRKGPLGRCAKVMSGAIFPEPLESVIPEGSHVRCCELHKDHAVTAHIHDVEHHDDASVRLHAYLRNTDASHSHVASSDAIAQSMADAHAAGAHTGPFASVRSAKAMRADQCKCQCDKSEAIGLGGAIDVPQPFAGEHGSQEADAAHSKHDPRAHLEYVEDDALFADTYVTPGSANEDLALKAKLLSTLGWRMASVGAETRLIVQSVKKMAHDLGCRNVEISISRDGIIVKLRRGHAIAVDFKEIKHFAINMDSLSRLHQICLCVSNGKLTDPHQIFMAIRAVRPRHYKKNQLIYIEAIAGACFAYLNGGNTAVCASALLGGLFLMYYRFMFIRRGFFESFTFMLSACIGSTVAALCCHYVFAAPHSQVMLSATATTLLLVPGFPLINGFLDIFKGHVPIGLNRLVIAGVLVVSAAVGLLMTSVIVSTVTAIFG